MKVLVDIDGTLLDGRADAEFQAKVKDCGIEAALEWYAVNCPDDLELNEAVLAQLVGYKALGYSIILWTNRGEAQWLTTMRNLSKYNLCGFFDILIFGNGSKKSLFDDKAIVFDNEWGNLEGAMEPHFIPTFTV